MAHKEINPTEKSEPQHGESSLLVQLQEQIASLQARVKILEGEIRLLRAREEKAPVDIPLAMPSVTLSMPVGRSKTSARSRTRSTPRPTVSYREDPRLTSSTNSGNCAEAGCERPVRSRGLCSKHYQRMRYRERKIEDKRSSVSPLPPPPPPPGKKSTGRKKQGGTRGVFAVL